jgi:hypothetical protein
MKKFTRVRVVGTSLLIAAFSCAAAEVASAPVFASAYGSGMVLPYGEPLTLSGHAPPRTRFTLKVGESRYELRSDARGDWRQQVAALRAGGPYRLELRDDHGAGATLTDVLAGELWLCSGQSNMEFAVAQSTDQPAGVMQGHPEIRLLSVPHLTALEVQDSFGQALAWQTATADSIRRFSALCYFFARQKIDDDGVPIGLVNASLGRVGHRAVDKRATARDAARVQAPGEVAAALSRQSASGGAGICPGLGQLVAGQFGYGAGVGTRRSRPQSGLAGRAAGRLAQLSGSATEEFHRQPVVFHKL